MEQPVGTGFSQGNVTATSEEDVAAQFMTWYKNFANTFGTQGYKIYIAGESYAGMFVPYIASAMLDANNTTYYDVDGILIYDPSIAWDSLQSEFVTLPFVEYWNGEWKDEEKGVLSLPRRCLQDSCATVMGGRTRGGM